MLKRAAMILAGVLTMALILRHAPPRHSQGRPATAARQAEAGRRLAIYERETGLLAHWYVELRCREECHRARRYSRPLSLLLAEPSPSADAWTITEQLREWLVNNARKTDIVGYVGNGRFVLLLPEADGPQAEDLAMRLQRAVPEAELGVACFDEDGDGFSALLASAERRLSRHAEAAA